MDWLLHEGYSIFWSGFHDVKMMNVANATMSACGRFLPVRMKYFRCFERPLLGKADIKPETPEIESENVRFTPAVSTDRRNTLS